MKRLSLMLKLSLIQHFTYTISSLIQSESHKSKSIHLIWLILDIVWADMDMLLVQSNLVFHGAF
jgi:hypothetical protein